MIKAIIHFRLFDRSHWEEIDLEETPLLIYSVKKRLIKKLQSIDNSGNPIEEEMDFVKDKTFREISFWEISLDNGNMCDIYKWIWAHWKAYPNKRRYKKYGRKYNDKNELTEVIRTFQKI